MYSKMTLIKFYEKHDWACPKSVQKNVFASVLRNNFLASMKDASSGKKRGIRYDIQDFGDSPTKVL